MSKEYRGASDQRHQRYDPSSFGVVAMDLETMPKLFQILLLFVRAPSYFVTKCVVQLYSPQVLLYTLLLALFFFFPAMPMQTAPVDANRTILPSSSGVIHTHYSPVKTKSGKRPGAGIMFAEARKKDRKAGPTLPTPPFIAHRASAFASNEYNAEMVREWYARELLERKRSKDIGGGGGGGGGDLSKQKLWAVDGGEDEDQNNAQGEGGVAAADTLGLGPLSSYNSRLGRENINSRDAFWRAGWQPVPMHAMASSYAAEFSNGDNNNKAHNDGPRDRDSTSAPNRVPYAHGAMEIQPIEPSGLETIIGRTSLVYEYAKKIATTAAAEGRKVSVADLRISQEILEEIAQNVVANERATATAMSAATNPNRINLTSYSYEVPSGHKIFLHISPNVDDLPRRHLDALRRDRNEEGTNGKSSRLYGPSSLSKDHPHSANPPPDEGSTKEERKSIEHWAGMCNAKTDTDWCFITIGCWGSGNIQTQTRVAKAMDKVLEQYAGRDLFPHRRRSSSQWEKGKGGAPSHEGKSNNYIEHPPALHHHGGNNNNNNNDGEQNYPIRPCDVRFGTINGDNFYQSGILRADTTRLVTGFELIYGSPALLTMPWLVSLGNHDYRGDWFQQTALMNRPVVENWGKVGHAGPDDIEIGDWVRTMNATTTALTTPSSSSSARTRPLRPLRAADVALLKKEQTFSTGRWYLPHPYYSARMSKELVMITLDCPLLERCHNNGDENPRCWDHGQQKGWLQSLLKTLDYDADLKYRIIQCHYPMYANGPHVNHQWLIDFIEPLMVRHGVQLYINADNHYIQVSKKTAIGGFGENGKIALKKEDQPKNEEEEDKNKVLLLGGAGDYFFVNSGGGGGYGLNHHRTDKGYATNPFNVFDEIRNGPFFHCLRGVGTPNERLITIAYNDDGEKLYEFVLRPYVSPIAVETNKARRFIEEQVRLYFLASAEEENKRGAGVGVGKGTPRDNDGEDSGDELIVQKKQQGVNHNNEKEREEGRNDGGSGGDEDDSSTLVMIGGSGNILRRRRENREVDVDPGFTYVLVILCCFCAFAFIVTRRYTNNGRRGGSVAVGGAGVAGHTGGAYAAGVVLGGGGASSPSLHGFTARSSSAAATVSNAVGVVVGSSPSGVEMIRAPRERN